MGLLSESNQPEVPAEVDIPAIDPKATGMARDTTSFNIFDFFIIKY